MRRRGFLQKTAGASVAPFVIGSAAATQSDAETTVDFGKLVTIAFEELPSEQAELESALMGLAETISTEFDSIDWETVKDLHSTLNDTNTTVRRLEFLIEILHNHDLASYLDEAWVAGFRNNINTVTRYLPILGSYNNFYHAAEKLNEAGNRNETVAAEKYDRFGFATIAFCVEVGLFYVGAPYRMAWRGTRFISNRTLLRAGRYVDNRLIGLVMSELHYGIRKQVYENVSSDSIESSYEYLKYLAGEFDELRQFAKDEGVTDGVANQSYLRSLDIDVQFYDLLQYGFLQQQFNGVLDEHDISGEITLAKSDLPDIESVGNSPTTDSGSNGEDDSGLPFGIPGF